MEWDEMIAKLEIALDNGDDAELSRWGDRFTDMVEKTDEYVPTEIAKKILTALQQHARFSLLCSIGELVSRRNHEVELRRRLSQSLIEMGEVTRAIENLLELKTEVEQELAVSPPPEKVLEHKALKAELPEIEGLLGRAYKKLYFDAQPTPRAPREEDYERARDYYLQAYQAEGGGVWHGVNLIALEAFRDVSVKRQDFTSNQDLKSHANTILKTVAPDSADPWDLASRAEALLALGRNKDAQEALAKYLGHKETTVFMVQSTRRQFREMWRLDPERPPGNTLLPMLDAAYASMGGPLDIERALRGGIDLEAVLSDTGFQPLGWMRTALDRARAIARVGRKPQRVTTRQANGTGFLVDGAQIHQRLANLPLLLTNAHVATSRDDVRDTYPDLDVLKIEETQVAFLETGSAAPRAIGVEKEWYTSPPDELDATLLQLKGRPDVPAPPLADSKVVLNDRVNILGHPGGDEMVVSLQDNRVMKVAGRKLFYRTPTERGSSGSPVFDQAWNLVALHHAGPAFSNSNANEGLLIGSVFEAIAAKLDAD